MKTRITEISLETEETVVVRWRRTGRSWCPACSADVEMVKPEAAAAVVGLGSREIYRRVEAGQVHFRESEDGGLLVCLDSLIGSSHCGREVS